MLLIGLPQAEWRRSQLPGCRRSSERAPVQPTQPGPAGAAVGRIPLEENHITVSYDGELVAGRMASSPQREIFPQPPMTRGPSGFWLKA